MKTSARRLGLGIVALSATLLTSACAAGQDAMTSVEVASIDGTEGSVGSMLLRAVVIETPPNGSYPVGGDATLEVVIVNNGSAPDSLTGVVAPAFSTATLFSNAAVAGAQSIDDATALSATPSAAPAAPSVGALDSVEIAPDTALSIGKGASGAPAVLFRGLTVEGAGVHKGLFPGESTAVTFSFEDAGSVTVQVPIALGETPHTVSIPPPSDSPAE